jgi:hypothetical protein
MYKSVKILGNKAFNSGYQKETLCYHKKNKFLVNKICEDIGVLKWIFYNK